MAYIRPVEAVTNRLNEIGMESGNLIFDIQLQKILYDSSKNARIDLSSIVVIDTEKELLEMSEGIVGKIYLAKDTSSLFYWDSRKWFAVKIAANAIIYDTFYVSENGSDENDGLTIDKPVKTIGNALNKATNLNTVNIQILDGTFNEGNLYVNNKAFINIFSEATSEMTMPTVNAILNVSNCNFKINNLKIGKINVTESNGTIRQVIINTTTVGEPDTGILLENSIANIRMSKFMDNSIAITADRNTVCSVTTITGSGNVVGFRVDKGSIISMYETSDIQAGVHHILERGGKIYLVDDPTDETTKKYINDEDEKLNTKINDIDTSLKESISEVDTKIDNTKEELTTSITNVDTKVNNLNTSITGSIDTLKTDISIDKVY